MAKIDTAISFSFHGTDSQNEVDFDESMKDDGTSWEEVLKTEIEDCVFGRTFGDYQIGELIGKGSQGNVYKGLNLKNGRFVAIKEVDLRKQDFLDDVPNILLEIDLLKELNHPNIVKLVDYHLEEKKFLHIVLEYIENGSVKDILSKFGYFHEGLSSKYAFQLLQGLNYLHEKDVLHRDIKGANILITKEGVCKLADFGVAMKIEPDIPITAVGSTYWMAPEIFEMRDTTKASDVWSFGCTVLELLTGSPPYGDLKPTVAMFQIVENEKPPYPPHISNECCNFLNGIFQREPNDRLTTKELLNHPWITLYNNTNFNKNTLKKLKDSLAIEANDDSNLLSAIKTSVAQKPQEFLTKLIQKNQNQSLNLQDLDISALKEKIATYQLENDLLSTITHKMHQEFLQIEYYNRTLIENIAMLEDNFVTSDEELAKLIYGDKLSMSVFTSANVSKGVLMTCKLKAKSSKLRWAKRWLVLQENFLFFYKEGDEGKQNQEPVDILKLRGAKIDVNAEIPRKYSFELQSGNSIYYLSAASASILMKWINLLQNTCDWYTSEVKLLTEKKISTPRRISQDIKLELKKLPQRKTSLTHNITHNITTSLTSSGNGNRKFTTEDARSVDTVSRKSLPNLAIVLPLGILSPRYSNIHNSNNNSSNLNENNPILSPRYNGSNGSNGVTSSPRSPTTSPRASPRSFTLFNSLKKKKIIHSSELLKSPRGSPDKNDQSDDDNDNDNEDSRPNHFYVDDSQSDIIRSLIDNPSKKEKSVTPRKKFDTIHPLKKLEKKRLSTGKIFANDIPQG